MGARVASIPWMRTRRRRLLLQRNLLRVTMGLSSRMWNGLSHQSPLVLLSADGSPDEMHKPNAYHSFYCGYLGISGPGNSVVLLFQVCRSCSKSAREVEILHLFGVCEAASFLRLRSRKHVAGESVRLGSLSGCARKIVSLVKVTGPPRHRPPQCQIFFHGC